LIVVKWYGCFKDCFRHAIGYDPKLALVFGSTGLPWSRTRWSHMCHVPNREVHFQLPVYNPMVI
jgi:hypothetical protein